MEQQEYLQLCDNVETFLSHMRENVEHLTIKKSKGNLKKI